MIDLEPASGDTEGNGAGAGSQLIPHAGAGQRQGRVLTPMDEVV